MKFISTLGKVLLYFTLIFCLDSVHAGVRPGNKQTVSAGGAINTTPAKFYDNDVAGGMPGINRIITVNNSGAGILSLSAINITGTNASEFILGSLPVFPATINSGDSISFTVAFNPASTGIKTASINISSDDIYNPVSSVLVRGLGTSGLGGSNEPSLQTILNLLEIPVIVGDDNSSTSVINSNISLQTTAFLGEEVSAQQFKKAGNGNVSITPLAVFGPTSNATVLGMGWYNASNAISSSELFTVSNNPLSNGQTVNVNYDGDTSFDPQSDVFGFYSRWPAFGDRYLYSEDNLNTFTGAIPHHARVYAFKDSNGVVPNTYLVAFEENTSGFDYQDLVFLVKNVKPATSSSDALLFVENLDKFPSNNDFVFSRIQIPWLGSDNVTYNANHDSLIVRIHNKGLGSLTINNLTLSDNTKWKIVELNSSPYSIGSGLPLVLNSGDHLDVAIKFIALNQASRVKVLHETLTITSNDDVSPTKIINLHGLWQKKGEGNNEPYSQEIIDAFGFKTTTGYVHTDPDFGDSTEIKGDEIKPSYFLRANSSLPVTVTQMGAYHGCCSSSGKLSWFVKGSTSSSLVCSHLGQDAQMLLPRNSTGSGIAASGTITTNAVFGFTVGANSSDPAINYLYKIGIRVYKAFDSKGRIIPNSYIIDNDILSDSSNYDYNDNMYFVTNVKPYIGTTYNSSLKPNPSALDFGEKVLQTSDSILLSVSSGGKVYSNGSQDPPITISSVVITGENQNEFSVSMPLQTTLAPQEATTIKVIFSPESEGLKIADLLIYYDNSLSPLRVPLYGIARKTNTAVFLNNRIKCGSSSDVVVNGKVWSSDTQYAFDNLEPYTNTSLSQITATDDDALYVREQSSSGDNLPFRYEIPVPNGDYVVRLHFAEIVWGAPGSGFNKGGPGSRVMSVKLENQLRLVNLDVASEVGVASALIINLPVTVTDGKIDIDFLASVNRPSVDAIEVYSLISSPLAVNTLNLNGTLVDNQTELEWTVSENNAKYFEVQRSTNKTDFATLGQVASGSNNSQSSKYTFTDENPFIDNNYYRIKQVNADGTIIYSKIIRIDFSKPISLQLFPNPAKDKINFRIPGIHSKELIVSIRNSLGSSIKKLTVYPNQQNELNISDLSVGLYTVSISGENFVLHKKFMKMR